MRKARLSFDRGGVLTRLRSAAVIAFWIHLIAGAAMALALRRGLETNPNLQDRLNFIVHQRLLWTGGWLTWTAAAIAILYFYNTFSLAHRLGRLPVLLAAAGIAADLSGQAIEIGMLPGLAERILGLSAGIHQFITLHRTAVMMSGCIGNGMYSLSALILAWSTRRVYPIWVCSPGIATGCFGLALSVAALMNSASGMLWTNVFLVPCILLWLAGVGFTVRQMR
jgi:hypothetical protein